MAQQSIYIVKEHCSKSRLCVYYFFNMQLLIVPIQSSFIFNLYLF